MYNRRTHARINEFHERGMADIDGFVRGESLACSYRQCGDIYDWLETRAGARDIHIIGIPRPYYKMGDYILSNAY